MLRTSSVIRVIIADSDHRGDKALLRRGTAVSMTPDMEGVGQVRNGEEAVQLALAMSPDVILMDLHMPVKGGAAATREITSVQPRTEVLVLTALDDDVFGAVRSGAQAYLLTDASEEELLETIRVLGRGESRLTPQIARKVMNKFRHSARAQEGPSPCADVTDPRGSTLAKGLTEKESGC